MVANNTFVSKDYKKPLIRTKCSFSKKVKMGIKKSRILCWFQIWRIIQQFLSLIVLGGTEVPIVYILLSRPSEDSLPSQMEAHLKTGSPLSAGEIAGFEPRTAVSQCYVATNKPQVLPNEPPLLSNEPSLLSNEQPLLPEKCTKKELDTKRHFFLGPCRKKVFRDYFFRNIFSE